MDAEVEGSADVFCVLSEGAEKMSTCRIRFLEQLLEFHKK